MSPTYFIKMLFLGSLITSLCCACSPATNNNPMSSNRPSPNTGSNLVTPSTPTNSSSPTNSTNPNTSTSASAKLPVATPTLASPKPQAQASFPILYYHCVSDNIKGMSELFVSPGEFRDQMNYLKKNTYDVISFEDIKNIENYKKPIIITFDDGYENNYLEAYPILKENKFPATIFVATDFINHNGYLTKEQIKDMGELIKIESHTISHPDLTKLSKDALELELSQSQKIIEDLTGHKSLSFAYPTGYFNPQVMAIVKKYYQYAVTTQSGLYNTDSDSFQIKRVYVPRGTTLSKFEKRLAKGSL